jgi:hypothetical protein
MGRQHQRRGTLTERDHRTVRRTVSKNHTTTAVQVKAELNILKTVSIKTVQHDLHKPNIHGRAATVEPLITESNAQMRKQWCHDHKTWTSDNWKHTRDMFQ